ncbi:ABC transporter substrate-binding protein [Streptomyces sp. NPDC002680]|uniref:ABC transporter substrate-binding protein n=1 Tax=Streptomyces sp. NPDC002680 TaxID=3364659 RepID=UPI0036952613
MKLGEFHPRRGTRSLSVLVAVGASLLAAGCTNTATKDSGGAALTDKVIPTFTWGLEAAPPSLDYAKSYASTAQSVLPLVTEPLERVASDGTFTPAVAASVTQPDATTIVYKLRSDARFSDGQPLKPEDVVWSIEHAVSPTAQSLAAIPGGVKKVSVTGPSEVTVKLPSAAPTARAGLAIAALVQEAKFAKAHAKDLGNADAPPVGTGPYKIDQFDAQKITLSRNASYAGTKPAPDKVVFSVVTDDNSRQLALRSGSIDGGQITNLKSGSQWRAIPGATVYSTAAFIQDFIALDTSKAPFDDVHVRRAVAYAIDKPGLAKAAFGDFATPLNSLVPAGELAGVAGSTKKAQQFVDGLPQYGFDMAKAKAELAKSATPKGFTTTVEYQSAIPWQKLAVLSLQQNLAPLGVTITPKSVTPNEWAAKFSQHQLTGLSPTGPFGATTPDPASLLGQFVGKDNIGPQRINIANWTTAKVEQALPTVNTAGTAASRWAATRTILSEVADQVPYVPLFTENTAFALREGYGFVKKDIDFYDVVNGGWIYDVKATA